MSADNCIVVLKTTTRFVRGANDEYGSSFWINQFKDIPVWRIAHVQGWDSLDWYEENQPYNVGAYLHSLSGECQPVYSEKEALVVADELEAKIGYLEYGVHHVDRFADWTLFSD